MSSSLFSLDERVAVVTGGTGVIGSALAQGLAEAGARVVVLARGEAALDQTAKRLTDDGHEAIGVRADVLDAASLEAARDRILEGSGRSTSSSTAPAGTSRARRSRTMPRRSRCRSTRIAKWSTST